MYICYTGYNIKISNEPQKIFNLATQKQKKRLKHTSMKPEMERIS